MNHIAVPGRQMFLSAALTIDKEKCKSEFRKFYEKEEVMIARIIAEKIKVLNSGIRIN